MVNKNKKSSFACREMFVRFTGCLLGGAVGDALGAPVEFMRRDEIRRRFGPHGIVDYAPLDDATPGSITDDTQMTLFTAEGLLRTWVRGRTRGLATFEGVTGYAYQRWLLTQGEWPESGADWALNAPGWLFGHRALHARRAPGQTCLAALRHGEPGAPARNDSKGCGGVMRVAPVGLYMARAGDAGEAFDVAARLAGLTHGHPTGRLAAGAFAAVVRELACGAALGDALDTAEALLRAQPGHEETLRALQAARRLARQGEDPARAIAQLGQGWVAEEALAIAVYCALVAEDFEHGVRLAVNHDGDSDSTGAIAGNLLGAITGAAAIPPRWLRPLELRHVLEEVAQDLYDFPDWPIDEYQPRTPQSVYLWAKYPGC